jgi:hypothetical protein
MGLTFGIPTVTFEAPPERLAAGRLHLPRPPGVDYKDMNIWHFGHTADPVYMGICTVALSLTYFWTSFLSFLLPFVCSFSVWKETDFRARRVRVGTVAMRWKQPATQEWNVFMIQ